MCEIIIFGSGEIAQLAKYYFDTDSGYEVVGFCVDKDYRLGDSFEGLPLVDFEEIDKIYSHEEYKMFIALSYSEMNEIRERKYHEAKEKGYELVSYISSKCSYLSQFSCGDNCFILEDNTIQPFVKIGSNVTLWSGNHIGHHSELKNHIFISSHVVISGHCIVNSNVFLGVNSTVGHAVNIAKGTLLGASTIITKDTEEGAVYVPQRSVKLDKISYDIKL